MSDLRDFFRRLSILLYGDTGDGKTTLAAELATYLFVTFGLRTRVYNSTGGWRTLRPQMRLGMVEIEHAGGDPWFWLHNTVLGRVRENGKWIDGVRDDVGMYVFESYTHIGNALMVDMAQQAARGVDIGGEKVFSFPVRDDKETMIIGSNNRAHYTLAQSRLMEESWKSLQLPGVVLWTALARRATDLDTNSPILGPQFPGKALTGEGPSWFDYTFRVGAIPQQTRSSDHILYLEDHIDPTAAMSKGLGNARVPLAGGKVVPVPFTFKPASLVAALEVLQRREDAAVEEIAAKHKIEITR